MSKPTKLLPALALGVTGVISAAVPALAVPITYTETVTGATGFLGVNPFTNATVTLTMNNNTSTVTKDTSQPEPIYDNVGTLTLSISNGETATFITDTFEASDNQNTTSGNPAAGFGDVNAANRAILFTTNAIAFSSYNLQTAIGPITGTAVNFSARQAFPTNEGSFILTTATGTATFTATVAVPAPLIGRGLPVVLACSGILFGTGLLERSRKRRSLDKHSSVKITANFSQVARS
jgi:hypothetical protein